MKIRTDLSALSLTGLIVVAIVVLTLLHAEVPSLLTEIGLVSLGVTGGAAAPAHLTSSPASSGGPLEAETSTPAALVAEVAAAAVPAPAPVPAVEQTQPAAQPAGRDWTETIPKITPEMIAADKASQA